jgi:ubiquitin-like 1-activating enzyme E1 B
MISPDVMVDDGKGTVLISSEEGETTENMTKLLSVRLDMKCAIL